MCIFFFYEFFLFSSLYQGLKYTIIEIECSHFIYLYLLLTLFKFLYNFLDIASALNHLDVKSNRHTMTPDHLSVSQSPSPFSSVESSPCRDTVYTPDFESDSEETGSGTSCSSTSGSFECIHNKFKDTIDISKVADESDKSASSREQSPMKIFSKTWDCHATPTKGVLVTPEKKVCLIVNIYFFRKFTHHLYLFKECV